MKNKKAINNIAKIAEKPKLPSTEIWIEYHVYCPKCCADTLLDKNEDRVIVCYGCSTPYMATSKH